MGVVLPGRISDFVDNIPSASKGFIHAGVPERAAVDVMCAAAHLLCRGARDILMPRHGFGIEH